MGLTPARGGCINLQAWNIGIETRVVDEHGAWRIVDIQVRGVSQLAMTRSQFVGILEREGFDGLINSLKDKIRELSGNPG
jgi:ABC-type transporter MlaC component